MTDRRIITASLATVLAGLLAFTAAGTAPAAAAPVPTVGATAATAPVPGSAPRAAAAAAVDYEIDFTTPGTPPDDVVCGDFDWTNSALACWEPYGDVVWVLSYGSQAVGWWWNYRGGALYRQGKCVNNHGDWGYCNKNMYEGSEVRFRACTSADQVDRECSAIVRTTT